MQKARKTLDCFGYFRSGEVFWAKFTAENSLKQTVVPGFHLPQTGEAFNHSIPCKRNVRQTIPGHCQELQYAE